MVRSRLVGRALRDRSQRRRFRLNGPRPRSRWPLAEQWREWLADNLLRGVRPARLVIQLTARGVPEAVARREIEGIRQSALYRAGRWHAVNAERLVQLQRLLLLQRRLADNAEEIRRLPLPDRATFFNDYYASSTPLILSDLVSTWPAHGRWTPSYLKERFGDVVVKVAIGRSSDPNYDMNTPKHTREMPLEEYVALVERIEAEGRGSNDVYMVARHRNLEHAALAALFEQVRLPEGWFDVDRFQGQSALWFGPAGTVTPLHHDTSNILFCQLYGRKRLTLVSPLETALVEGATSMYAAVDPEVEGEGGVPDDVVVKRCVLEPGDALFIPVGWWHHVRALDTSISLALNNFSRPNNFDWYRPGEAHLLSE